jgi:hypothetical protein
VKGAIMKMELTDEQALVFFEWLSRLSDQDSFPCDHEAEEYVLWSLHGQLEKQLTAQFKPNYRELVTAAREHVKANQCAG